MEIQDHALLFCTSEVVVWQVQGHLVLWVNSSTSSQKILVSLQRWVPGHWSAAGRGFWNKGSLFEPIIQSESLQAALTEVGEADIASCTDL